MHPVIVMIVIQPTAYMFVGYMKKGPYRSGYGPFIDKMS